MCICIDKSRNEIISDVNTLFSNYPIDKTYFLILLS